jgi:hypothetical protein
MNADVAKILSDGRKNFIYKDKNHYDLDAWHWRLVLFCAATVEQRCQLLSCKCFFLDAIEAVEMLIIVKMFETYVYDSLKYTNLQSDIDEYKRRTDMIQLVHNSDNGSIKTAFCLNPDNQHEVINRGNFETVNISKLLRDNTNINNSCIVNFYMLLCENNFESFFYVDKFKKDCKKTISYCVAFLFIGAIIAVLPLCFVKFCLKIKFQLIFLSCMFAIILIVPAELIIDCRDLQKKISQATNSTTRDYKYDLSFLFRFDFYKDHKLTEIVDDCFTHLIEYNNR